MLIEEISSEEKENLEEKLTAVTAESSAEESSAEAPEEENLLGGEEEESPEEELEPEEPRTRAKGTIRVKIMVILTVLFVSLSILMAIVIYGNYSGVMTGFYAELAYSQACIVADYVDGDSIKKYYETSEKDEYYYEALDFLQDIKEASGLKYLYVVIPREEDYYYIWDAGDPSEEEGVMDLGDADMYYDGGDVHMKNAFQNSDVKEMMISDNPVYGWVASAFVPIYDSQGNPVALASVDISIQKVINQIRDFLVMFVVIMGVIMIIAQGVFYYAMNRMVVSPIRKLDDLVYHFVQEQMKQGKTLNPNIYTNDEVGNLAASVHDMSREIALYMNQFEKSTKEKQKIQTELGVATQIQADMLPQDFPAYPDRHEFDIYAAMDPAKEVGGDFYDFFLVDEDHLALVMADVSGKGVPAALFMVISKTLIKNRTMMGGTPAEILKDVNLQLCENNEADLFVTVWLAIVELSTGKGIVCNAGHEHPALYHKDTNKYELQVYEHSPAVALMDFMEFENREFTVKPGDVIFIYTDGVPEATDAHDELFGTDRMIVALNQDPKAEPEQVLKNVRAAVDEFVGEAPQFDDLTMLAVKFNGKQS